MRFSFLKATALLSLLLCRHLAGLAPLGAILRTLVRLVRTNPYVVRLLRFQFRDLLGYSGSLLIQLLVSF